MFRLLSLLSLLLYLYLGELHNNCYLPHWFTAAQVGHYAAYPVQPLQQENLAKLNLIRLTRRHFQGS